jgi:plasmid stabilization system protein ParE
MLDVVRPGLRRGDVDGPGGGSVWPDGLDRRRGGRARVRAGRGRRSQEANHGQAHLDRRAGPASRRRRAQHLEAAVRALLESERWTRGCVWSRKGLALLVVNQVQIALQRPDSPPCVVAAILSTEVQGVFGYVAAGGI